MILLRDPTELSGVRTASGIILPTIRRETISPQSVTTEGNQIVRETELFTRGENLRAESVRESDRSVVAVVTSEEPATVFDYEAYELIDEILVSKGMRFTQHVPFLRNHCRDSELDVVGHANGWKSLRSVWEGRIFVAEPATDEDPVRQIWSRIKGGHLRGVSIGYWPQRYVDLPAGESAKIEGKTYTAGLRRLRVTLETLVFELSIVPVGADKNALIRGSHNPLTRHGKESLEVRSSSESPDPRNLSKGIFR